VEYVASQATTGEHAHKSEIQRELQSEQSPINVSPDIWSSWNENLNSNLCLINLVTSGPCLIQLHPVNLLSALPATTLS
jgi:hypothetical protein